MHVAASLHGQITSGAMSIFRKIPETEAPMALQLPISRTRSLMLAGVLHYHAVYIKPSWARGDKPIVRIGQHLFYR